MVWVSELPGARWPPCADVRLRWTRHLAFIYIYGSSPQLAGVFEASPRLKHKTVILVPSLIALLIPLNGRRDTGNVWGQTTLMRCFFYLEKVIIYYMVIS